MKKLAALLILFALLAAIALVTFLAPLEQTLGANARIVYLHGAWVWAALAAFLAAGFSGLAGFVFNLRGQAARAEGWMRWSQALGWSSLLLWISFLPQSLFVMQANWNGLFLDEPRFRIPLNYAIVGLLMQIGLWFLPLRWTALGNALFAAILFTGMSGMQTVLHPESPIFQPGAGDIRTFFAILVVLILLAAGCFTWLIKK